MALAISRLVGINSAQSVELRVLWSQTVTPMSTAMFVEGMTYANMASVLVGRKNGKPDRLHPLMVSDKYSNKGEGGRNRGYTFSGVWLGRGLGDFMAVNISMSKRDYNRKIFINDN